MPTLHIVLVRWESQDLSARSPIVRQKTKLNSKREIRKLNFPWKNRSATETVKTHNKNNAATENVKALWRLKLKSTCGLFVTRDGGSQRLSNWWAAAIPRSSSASTQDINHEDLSNLMYCILNCIACIVRNPLPKHNIVVETSTQAFHIDLQQCPWHKFTTPK